ncbi:hypothetical protein K5X82_18805 [Halosquirtibacter xylanolyticus]|uniref:hypothetical protein n=1 Tax=Halosquirtibacter xylanolyticus TaxID=3374599 RepID=UPI00374914CB|nr:hypothetical protein K5X82_18805 [Prolixibacteraceae bacterium]
MKQIRLMNTDLYCGLGARGVELRRHKENNIATDWTDFHGSLLMYRGWDTDETD